uniref:Uncharacterized protein n=1 Tax=Mastacembelus armatus TaxID=205130 RepID=A0A3Q3LJA6_9TELE
VKYECQNCVRTMKYGGGSIMIWGCFTASGPGQLAIVEGKINSQVYKINSQVYYVIFQHNVRVGGCKLWSSEMILLWYGTI